MKYSNADLAYAYAVINAARDLRNEDGLKFESSLADGPTKDAQLDAWYEANPVAKYLDAAGRRIEEFADIVIPRTKPAAVEH